jgi:hypothetical protein
MRSKRTAKAQTGLQLHFSSWESETLLPTARLSEPQLYVIVAFSQRTTSSCILSSTGLTVAVLNPVGGWMDGRLTALT